MLNKTQLFCFTYAGGTADFFNLVENDLDGVELVKLEYAGHGMRHKEGFYNDFQELADDLFSKVKANLKGDYAIFGYSMGCISAVEVLKRIIAAQMPLPSNMFLAAHEPHTKAELLGYTDEELDEWVKVRTIEFGDVPERLLNNKVFWRTYLPIYRADYSIIGKYEFDKLNLKSDIPTTIFYSETDTPLSDMRRWNDYFIGNIEYRKYEGNHFFIKEHHRDIANIIKGKLGEKE